MDAARSFRSMVGCLIYLTHTHPDIEFSIGIISRFIQQHSKVQFEEAKRVLHYVAGSMDYGIWYSQVSNFRLCGFTIGTIDVRLKIHILNHYLHYIYYLYLSFLSMNIIDCAE